MKIGIPDSPSEPIPTVQRSAAYEQLLEILDAAARQDLSSTPFLALLDELSAYLEKELQRFEAFPDEADANYLDGLNRVSEGLQGLLEACQRARQFTEGGDTAHLDAARIQAGQAESQLLLGHQRLQRAR